MDLKINIPMHTVCRFDPRQTFIRSWLAPTHVTWLMTHTHVTWLMTHTHVTWLMTFIRSRLAPGPDLHCAQEILISTIHAIMPDRLAQYIATRCNTLPHSATTTHCNTTHKKCVQNRIAQYTVQPCDEMSLQRTATHCNTLQHCLIQGVMKTWTGWHHPISPFSQNEKSPV